MVMTIPALSFDGVIPALPVGVESAAPALLVLAGLLGAAAMMLIRFRRCGAARAVGRRRTGRPRSQAGRVVVSATRAREGYRRFLAGRDGVPDLGRHSLARREAFFAGLSAAPLRSQAPIDRSAYLRNVHRHHIEPGLDARVLWLLATAKSNQAERFGVGLAELYGRVPAVDEDPVRVHLHLQELYHTRILADVVALFDLPVHPAPPPLMTRAMIEGMVFAPPHWTLPLVGFGEMAGCVLFRALRDRGVLLFADEPGIADRVWLLYDEILADEISHVGFITAQMGPTGRRVMLWLYRRLGVRLAMQMPELAMLFGAAELARLFKGFPLDAMVAEVGDKAYSFGVPALAAVECEGRS